MQKVTRVWVRASFSFQSELRRQLVRQNIITRRVVYQESNEYHQILRGLFKNFKTPTIINKLLLSHVYYGGGFKILK